MAIFNFISDNENTLRVGFFFSVLVLMAVWETRAPRRALTQPRALRWANNLGLVFLNSFILRLIFPAAATGVALFAAEHGWGLLNYYSLPLGVSVLSAVRCWVKDDVRAVLGELTVGLVGKPRLRQRTSALKRQIAEIEDFVIRHPTATPLAPRRACPPPCAQGCGNALTSCLDYLQRKPVLPTRAAR